MVRVADEIRLEPQVRPDTGSLSALSPRVPSSGVEWRAGLPYLSGSRVTLRELEAQDASPLFVALNSQQVNRFLSPPPSSVDGFERFIAWAQRQRALGQFACFAVVPHGSDAPVGLFQVRALDSSFGTAEWGFALAAERWGTGIFLDGARLVIDFAFGVIGAHRLEARAAIRNGRGNGALRKLGAVQEGLLRRSFLRNGEYLDQALWTIVEDEWSGSPRTRGERTIFH